MKSESRKYLLTLSKELFNQLENIANKNGESVASIMRDALRIYVYDSPTGNF